MLSYIFVHVRSIIDSCDLGVCFYISRMSCYSQIVIIMDHGVAILNIREIKSSRSEFVRSIVE